MPKTLQMKCRGLRKRGFAGKAESGFASPRSHSWGLGNFASEVVLPLEELADGISPNMRRFGVTVVRRPYIIGERRQEIMERLSRIGELSARPVFRHEAILLLRVAVRILHKADALGGNDHVKEFGQAIANLKNAIVKASRGGRYSFGSVMKAERERPEQMTALGAAAAKVVKAAMPVIQFINCHDMKVSVSNRGGRPWIVVDGSGGGGGGGNEPPEPPERLRKIEGVNSTPYVIDEKKNTIRYRSNGHDKMQSKTYRIPKGGASKAVNTLVKGMVNGIREGRDDWSAPFTYDDAKALGRETKLDNRAFLADCVVRAQLRGRGRQTYANSAQLRHFGMPEP